jgi:hypothetical protein
LSVANKLRCRAKSAAAITPTSRPLRRPMNGSMPGRNGASGNALQLGRREHSVIAATGGNPASASRPSPLVARLTEHGSSTLTGVVIAIDASKNRNNGPPAFVSFGEVAGAKFAARGSWEEPLSRLQSRNQGREFARRSCSFPTRQTAI